MKLKNPSVGIVFLDLILTAPLLRSQFLVQVILIVPMVSSEDSLNLQPIPQLTSIVPVVVGMSKRDGIF